MKIVFDSYLPEEDIPVRPYLKDKKLYKFFNRETAAAIVGVGKLLKGVEWKMEMPFYYATGLMEYEDYGLKEVVQNSIDDKRTFNQRFFVEKGLTKISPLNQFKVLQNMPLSFVSIVFGLKGDNAVIYSSASGLLLQTLHSLKEAPILIGAGKVYKDGKVESGFAIIGKKDIKNSSFLSSQKEAVEIFRLWSERKAI